jgi:hypothetical protein
VSDSLAKILGRWLEKRAGSSSESVTESLVDSPDAGFRCAFELRLSLDLDRVAKDL